MTTIAVIGTAGRQGLHHQMDLSTVKWMEQQVIELAAWTARLISGGAAWADHTAVRLFLNHRIQFPELELFLPCPWRYDRVRFQDSGIRDWRTNPGGTANYYHRLYKERTGIDSLAEINQAIQEGAKTHVGSGFHGRNTQVAATATQLIAFTFGQGDEPDDGGTLHTWHEAKKCGVECIHKTLPEMVSRGGLNHY